MSKMDADGEDPKEYRWESGYEKTWEAITEDDHGMLDGAIAEIIQKEKRRRQLEKAQPNRLGMMRHLFVVLDASESMKVPDLKPTRWICTLKLLELFVDEFYMQNPISQLGIILLRNKRGEKLTDLTGTAKLHLKSLQTLRNIPLTGEPSIQNGLELALNLLKVVPSHASREVVLILGTLTTCDPGDANATIDAMKSEGIRCSVISLSAEMYLCRELTTKTLGRFSAVLDDSHFRDQLMVHVDPPATARGHQSAQIKMGFPHASVDGNTKDPPLSMCMCHISNEDEPSKLTTGGYHCPQCYGKYCELPVECLVCGLTLVSAPHLARSYHHLFPVPHFKEIAFEGQTKECYSCKHIFIESDKQIYLCENCEQFYCIDCDIFMHDTLHACVGCNTVPKAANQLHLQKAQMPAGGLPNENSGYDRNVTNNSNYRNNGMSSRV